MSDLAPLVNAATGTIRDKAFSDLVEENKKLKKKVEKLEKNASEVNIVKIKKGHGEDEEVYAKGQVDVDGLGVAVDKFLPIWVVGLHDVSEEGVKCHYTDLLGLKISIGDTAKDLFDLDEYEDFSFTRW